MQTQMQNTRVQSKDWKDSDTFSETDNKININLKQQIIGSTTKVYTWNKAPTKQNELLNKALFLFLCKI